MPKPHLSTLSQNNLQVFLCVLFYNSNAPIFPSPSSALSSSALLFLMVGLLREPVCNRPQSHTDIHSDSENLKY